MRKQYRFLIFSFLFLFVFACDLRLPNEIEIIAKTPLLRFSGDAIDMTELFGDMKFDFGSDEEVSVLDCNDTVILTKLIYLELFNENIIDDLSNPELVFVLDDSGNYYLSGSSRQKLIESSEPIEVKAPDFANDNPELDGFIIEDSIARLYISGTNQEFLDMLDVVLVKDGESIPNKNNGESFGRSEPSYISKSDKEYSGDFLPSSENEFDFTFDEDYEIEFFVYLKANQRIPKAWIDEKIDIYLLIEIAVWVPFKLIVTDPDGKEMRLPLSNMFGDEDNEDLFGRKPGDDDSFADNIDYLNVDIILTENPFPEAKLVIKSPAMQTIEQQITNRFYRIRINKDDLVFPFLPEFFVMIDYNKNIIIPNNLAIIEEMVFSAKLSYLIEIDEEDLPKGWTH